MINTEKACHMARFSFGKDGFALTEPEFYQIKQSGVLFDNGGILLKDSSGETHTYYGVGHTLFDQAKAGGYLPSASATMSCVHSWDDWGLFWTDVTIGAPEVETSTQTIPGRHGILDYSEVITGAPVYHNRTLELSFVKFGKMTTWHAEYTEMLERLHGQIVQWIFDTDPGYYYNGRCTGVSVREDGVHNSVTLTLDADPWKYAIWDSVSDWLWDPFCFEGGVVPGYQVTDSAGTTVLYNYRDILVGQGKTVTVPVSYGGMAVYPEIVVRYPDLTEETVENTKDGKLTIDIYRKNTTVETHTLSLREVTWENVQSGNALTTASGLFALGKDVTKVTLRYSGNLEQIAVSIVFREVRL